MKAFDVFTSLLLVSVCALFTFCVFAGIVREDIPITTAAQFGYAVGACSVVAIVILIVSIIDLRR